MAFETLRLKRPRPWAWDRWALAAVPLLFLAVVLVAPAVRLMLEGGSADLLAPWQDPYLRGRLLWSLAQAAITCGLVLLIGLPMGWVLARLDFPGRGLLLRGLMLPFVVPTLVAAMGVLALMGPRGLLAQWGGPDLQATPRLRRLGNLFFNLSLVVRAGMDGLAQVSAQRVAVARTLGATPWRAFWRVEWPVIAPWLASALCLVFLYCFTGFGLALVLGGQRWATVEVEIYTLIAHELALAQAASLAVAMLALTVGMAWAYAWVERRLASPARITPVPRRPVRGLAIWSGWALALGAWLLLCGAPLLALLLQAAQAVGFGQGWEVLREDDTWRAVGNTLRFSGLALALATALASSGLSMR